MSGEVGITSFKVRDEQDIILASKIVIKFGCRPHRIVLRKLDSGKYVTHEEVLGLVGDTWVHDGYNHGNYFEEGYGAYTSEAEARRAAHDDFNERAARL